MSRDRNLHDIASWSVWGASDLEPEEYGPFTERQSALFWFQIGLTQALGKFDQSAGPDGAHYFNSTQNPFNEEGLACGNCAFFEGTNSCEIVDGSIDPQGLCKNWIIPEGLTAPMEGTKSPADQAPKPAAKPASKPLQKAAWQKKRVKKPKKHYGV